MANNRMALVCNKCNLGIAIAKFYPQGGFISGEGSGWGFWQSDEHFVSDFFVRHAHDFDKSAFGGNQYRLAYEMDDDTWKYEPNLSRLFLNNSLWP